MLNLRGTRRGGTKGRILALIVFVCVLFVNQRSRSSRNNAAVDPATSDAPASADGKYVPEGDEGLGASIAILLDVSGSMKSTAKGDSRPKYLVAREALNGIIEATDSFVVRQPGFPVNVGLYTFSDEVQRIVPVKPYNRLELTRALAALGKPDGGTAIGDAMDVARQDLYRAGTIRKYILVVTDGENTSGRSPESVATEINRRSEGAVRQYFVAFDIDAEKFGFLKAVHGDVLGAANGLALRASLDTIYKGRILAEAMNAGETLPPARSDTGATSGKKQ